MPRRVPTHRPNRPPVPSRPKPRSAVDQAWWNLINSPPWRRCARAFRLANPLCGICYSQGRLTPTEQVHHVDGQAFDDPFNHDRLYPLCRSCHSRVSRLQQAGQAVELPPKPDLS